MTVTRRSFLKTSLTLLAGGALPPYLTRAAGNQSLPGAQGRRIPVILDSDIGDDIDDTWALLMLLRSPQFDVKLVVSDFGNAIYRCRLFAKLLELTGCTHIPVGVGLEPDDEVGRQSGWIGDYRLEDYPGTVYRDGVQALIDTIRQSPEPVTLLCIGPVPNIAEALRREPAIAGNARFVGMHGSIYKGYDGVATPAAEVERQVQCESAATGIRRPLGLHHHAAGHLRAGNIDRRELPENLSQRRSLAQGFDRELPDLATPGAVHQTGGLTRA